MHTAAGTGDIEGKVEICQLDHAQNKTIIYPTPWGLGIQCVDDISR